MPGFDRTGPEGKGPQTGRGEGNCGSDSKETKSVESLKNEKGEIFGLGRGGRPRGGGRGLGYGGRRRRNGRSGIGRGNRGGE